MRRGAASPPKLPFATTATWLVAQHTDRPLLAPLLLVLVLLVLVAMLPALMMGDGCGMVLRMSGAGVGLGWQWEESVFRFPISQISGHVLLLRRREWRPSGARHH